jgi:hypothetical protein
MVADQFDQGYVEGARDRVNLVYEVVSAFEKEAAIIRETHKPEYAGQEISALAQRFDTRLVKIEGSLKDWRDNIKQLEEKIRPAKAEQAPSHAEQLEVREVLRQWDPLRVQLAYEEATRTGNDPLLEAAIENCPKIAPLVKPEVIEAGRQARAVRNSPEAARKLATLKKSLKLVTEAIASARRSWGVPEADPILRIAREGA